MSKKNNQILKHCSGFFLGIISVGIAIRIVVNSSLINSISDQYLRFIIGMPLGSISSMVSFYFTIILWRKIMHKFHLITKEELELSIFYLGFNIEEK